jgi:hypothetical protein
VLATCPSFLASLSPALFGREGRGVGFLTGARLAAESEECWETTALMSEARRAAGVLQAATCRTTIDDETT